MALAVVADLRHNPLQLAAAHAQAVRQCATEQAQAGAAMHNGSIAKALQRPKPASTPQPFARRVISAALTMSSAATPIHNVRARPVTAMSSRVEASGVR